MTTQNVAYRALDILDHGQAIAISFEDILKYHGRQSIGGVAHAFKVLELALRELGQGKAPERYDLTVATAFPGGGARDAFEMVTRAVTGGRYEVDPALAAPGTVEAPHGHYFFRIGYRGRAIDLALRPGLVREEFIALVRAGAQTMEKKQRLDWLKQDMTDRLLALPAHEVYDVVG